MVMVVIVLSAYGYRGSSTYFAADHGIVRASVSPRVVTGMSACSWNTITTLVERLSRVLRSVDLEMDRLVTPVLFVEE